MSRGGTPNETRGWPGCVMIEVMQVAALRKKTQNPADFKPTKIMNLLNFPVMELFADICLLIWHSDLIFDSIT